MYTTCKNHVVFHIIFLLDVPYIRVVDTYQSKAYIDAFYSIYDQCDSVMRTLIVHKNARWYSRIVRYAL